MQLMRRDDGGLFVARVSAPFGSSESSVMHLPAEEPRGCSPAARLPGIPEASSGDGASGAPRASFSRREMQVCVCLVECVLSSRADARRGAARMLAGGAPAGDCQGDLRRRRRGPAEGEFPEEVQVCVWLKVFSFRRRARLPGMATLAGGVARIVERSCPRSPAGALAGDSRSDARRRRVAWRTQTNERKCGGRGFPRRGLPPAWRELSAGGRACR